MARRTILVAMAAALAAVWPASTHAATAPAGAPDLTSTMYAYPAILHWTPGNNGLIDQTQGVYRKTGNCATTADPGGPIVLGLANTVNTYTARPVDGIWCFFIRATDLLGSADSLGLTVLVDTINPVATVAVSGQNPAGTVSGTVNVTGTATDAVSGVASSVFRAGAVGACAAGSVVGPAWDTTALANGAYDVCNVVTDNAGHVAIAKLTLTVANTPPPAPPAPPAVNPGVVPVTIVGTVIGGDTTAPGAPAKLSLVIPRAKVSAAKVRVTLRWVNPVASDLDRVVVLFNQKRAPRGPGDGSKVYKGLRTSVALTLKAGQTAWVALFAYDRTGNVSPPARRKISLASLIPLRPLTGSVVDKPPLLTWKGQDGVAYYNVQVFRNGRRVIVGWPSHASYRVPLGTLEPGTYVWFVWPAEKRDDGTPAFGHLIGRATFVYAE